MIGARTFMHQSLVLKLGGQNYRKTLKRLMRT